VLTVALPKLAGVYVTEHTPLASMVHDAALNWVVDPVSVVQVTVPVGLVAPPPVTVARHTVGALIGLGLGVQLMVVVVPSTAARSKLPLLGACVVALPL